MIILCSQPLGPFINKIRIPLTTLSPTHLEAPLDIDHFSGGKGWRGRPKLDNEEDKQEREHNTQGVRLQVQLWQQISHRQLEKGEHNAKVPDLVHSPTIMGYFNILLSSFII